MYTTGTVYNKTQIIDIYIMCKIRKNICAMTRGTERILFD